MPFHLPERLESLLRQNRRLAASVELTLTNFRPWIADKQLVFFPEYTDHGAEHLNAVLRAADGLIRDESWAALAPVDAAVLVLSVLLHDSGMHLREEGFQRLVTDVRRPLLRGFDDVPWPTLWNDFLRETSRFDSNKWNAILGHNRPIKIVSLDKAQLTRDHRLLIGDFLRRHHGRLAHEIAYWGVPGPGDSPLKFEGVSQHVADLSGVVARSHSVPIRTATEALPVLERRDSEGVHAPFLMAVLRIADFLRLESERAPEALLKVMSIQSPVSRGEWNTHHAIRHISMIDADPEAVRIKAEPRDVGTYLRLRSLLAAIQDELDESWAVLGETYGRFPELKGLGLTLRRVRSNLDDERAFAKTVAYVPTRAAFVAAGGELLKLLVGPLYGNEPAIGIRELLQNAVDACRELEVYLKNHSELKPHVQEQEADVVIRLDRDVDGVGWVTVNDRGIGMTVEIIQNYFLRAGATFRLARAWRDEFENESGHSAVLRSGRFGVGVLAAFLLGDSIEVTTRWVGDERGIRFEGSLGSPHLQLDWHDRPVGTTVRVRINDPQVLAVLEKEPETWDWYCLDKPLVLRYGTNAQKLHQRFRLPAARARLPLQLHRINAEGFDDVVWSLDQYAPPIVCNGIVVSSPQRFFFTDRQSFADKGMLVIRQPSLSVFDSDGKLPLVLQRTHLVGKLPFQTPLFEDVCKDFFAYLLVRALRRTGQKSGPPRVDEPIAYPLLTEAWTAHGWSPYWYTEEGFSLTDSWHIATVHPTRLLLVVSDRRRPVRSVGQVRSAMVSYLMPDHFESSLADLSQAQDEVIELFSGGALVKGTPLGSVKPRGVRVFARKYSDWSLNSIDSGQKGDRDGWTSVQLGNCADPSFDPAQIPKELESKIDLIAEWQLAARPAARITPVSCLAKLWERILGHPIIPYSEKLRRRRFARAYELLQPYIRRHEKIAPADLDEAR